VRERQAGGDEPAAAATPVAASGDGD